MKRASVAVLLGVTLVAAGCASSHKRSSHVQSTHGAAPAPTPTQMHVFARAIEEKATEWGDPRPTRALVVPTTQRRALLIGSGGGSAPATPAYLVVAYGHFVAGDVPIPRGAKAPTGTVLTMTFDAKTNRFLDEGLLHRAGPLTRVGQPEPLPLVGTGVAPASRVVAEIAVARYTDANLFAIFPSRPGVRRCQIPSGAGLVVTPISGTCATRVWYPDTHGHGEARVEFRETWGNGHRSSWTLWEELPSLKVLVTKLRGETSPQMRLRQSD